VLSALRQTLRLLLKSPGFTITAILILGFGIGINTAIFSLINDVLLKALPYPHPERLVSIFTPIDTVSTLGIDLPDYVDLRASQHSFDGLAALDDEVLDLNDTGEPRRIDVGFVSASLFKVTGRACILGRAFTDEEDRFGGPLLVVVAERFWREHFDSDPGIIGKNIRLSGRNYEIVGVCPTQVDDWGIDSPKLYVPVHSVARADDPVWRRDSHFLGCYGRLKPGVTAEQAQMDLDIIRRELVNRYPDTNRGYGVRVMSLLDAMVSDSSSSLWLVGGSVFCLLLIAIANVANLLFCRGIERQKQIVIRRALGASRLSLAGQALLESLVLSLAGAGVGLLIGLWSIGLIKVIGLQEQLARVVNIGFDRSSLIFFIIVTGLVALLSGLLPALRAAMVSVGTALKDNSGRSGTGGPKRQKTLRFLVIGQVALSSVLLIGTGLLIRSYVAAQTRSPGFNADRLLAAEIWLTGQKYNDSTFTRQFFDRVLEGIRHIPGVTDAAMNEDLPFNRYWSFNDPFLVPGKAAPELGHEPRLASQRVSPDYFRTLQIPLSHGRDFSEEDTPTSLPVIIIDQALASRFFPNEDPLGKQIENPASWAENKSCTIVGVAGNVLHTSPDGQHAAFDAYFPNNQWPMSHQVFVLRSSSDPTALIPAVRKIVASVDPDVPVVKITTVNDLIEERFTSRRTGMLLTGVFSTTALLLSAIGIYGTLAYTVIQRTREMGIRISLGATSSVIVRLVLRDGFKIVGLGLLTGIAAAESASNLIQSVLYGVSSNDPIAIGGAIIVLAVAGFIACLLPAARAARINPITALRNE
jgi:putative ABC transport system permease protein